MRSGVRGLIIAAAFIGPGTVTTATIVGAQTGFSLIWLLIFAILATFVLQEMASRVGTISGLNLSQAIMRSLPNKFIKMCIGSLIIAAIGLGNAAYEGGNISGAALGLVASFGGSINTWAAILGLSALALLASGRYKVVEKCLIGLVVVMSFMFITLMLLVGINTTELSSGFLLKDDLLSNTSLALAIIGTTIVPYNLFLHAGLSAREHHANSVPSAQEKGQLFASIGLGGLVTFAILSSSVSAFFVTQIQVDTSNIGIQLRPLLGDYASLFFGVGLFAAGLTSAITAPLAAAYAIGGLFNWQSELSDKRFMLTAVCIVIVGTVTASIGIKPLALIIIAQTSNALLLPISAALLVWVCNRREIMKNYTNSMPNNLFAITVVVLVLVIAASKLWQ